MSAPLHESVEQIHALIALYRATHFDVALPDGRTSSLHIGRIAPPELRDWIGADALATFLTACNPRSQTLPDAENALHLETLRTRLRAWDCRFLEGVGHIPGEHWCEPSLFVAGLDLAGVDALARKFDQNAVITVVGDNDARLRIHRVDWCHALRDETYIDCAGER
jgi:glycine/D-amino acid oxidase-like deaminating enzyme